ncbi:T9SS type A sorting domain-containing protein [candidate division KSB1 bacterium]|nr:T9SS type A sorting domain-containing protein [candidate division KSB1 bacterium]
MRKIFVVILGLSLFLFSTTFANVLKSVLLKPSLNIDRHFDYMDPRQGLSLPDTIHILALRADFLADNTMTTTGGGTFDLGETSDYNFDRPPHNRTYFEHQLKALSYYFKRASAGKLLLEATVLPAGENDVYHLPNNMAYYSGKEDEDLKQIGWAELLRDAVQIAQEQDHVDFSPYQAVFVFHAGVGNDFAFDFDETPYDIQSVFFDFESLKKVFAPDNPDYQGIETSNGVFIREGIILPETQNQAGYDLGLLGTMTLLTGSYLGMPSLFDTGSGRPGIGRWGLMDQGSYNFQGFIPAEPCAWMKVFMGWEEPVVVTNAEDVKIGTAETTSVPHLIKIPVSRDEYFLLENRQRDWDGNGRAFGWDEAGNRVQFDSTGKISWEEEFGVLTRISEYDFGLPGTGILIWHIDERIIRENLQANTINDNRDHRGVDLVECDGAQDIGYYYSMFDAAYGTESGDYWDAYWGGNESHKYVNNDKAVEFSSVSIPNSKTYDGSVSHIKIYNFSTRDTVMTCSVISELTQKGFESPPYVGQALLDGSLLGVTVNGEKTIVAVTALGNILGWKGDGSKLIGNDRTVEFQDVGGKNIIYDYALMASLDRSIILPPAAADLTGDGNDEIVVVDENKTVYVYSLLDQDADGYADLLSKALTNFEGEFTAGILILKNTGTNGSKIVLGTSGGWINIVLWENGTLTGTRVMGSFQGPVTGLAAIEQLNYDLIAASVSGEIAAFNSDESIVWRSNVPEQNAVLQPLVANGSGEENPFIYLASNNGRIYVFSTDGLLQQTSDTYYAPKFSTPALGHLNDNGMLEIIGNGPKGLWAFSSTLASVLNFPVQTSQDEDNQPVSPLLISQDKNQAVILTSNAAGQIFAITQAGMCLTGYPVTAGNRLRSTPVLTDLDGDGDWELAAVTEETFLYIWDLNFACSEEKNNWTQYGGNASRTFSALNFAASTGSETSFLPPNKVFCYPNPTEDNRTIIRYTLTGPAQSVEIRIYDIAGEFVQKLNGTPLSIGDHEIVWDVAEIESGVYIARLEAQSESNSFVEFIKIAVVK